MLTFLSALAATPRASLPPALHTSLLPAEFPWRPDFSVTKTDDIYTANYDPSDDKPTGTPVWVSALGDDLSGDGSEALPYRSIAMARANGNVVHIKSGFYADHHADFGMDILADTAMIAADGPGSVIWASSPDDVVWTLETGNVYRANIAQSVNDVVDLSYVRGGEYLKDGVGEVPELYLEQSSIGDVGLNAGSFFYDGGVLYLHTHDGRAPDGDVKPLWSNAIWSSSGFINTLYLEGIEFWGGQQPLRITGSTSVPSSKVVAVDCGFRYASALGNAKCDAVRDVRFVRCATSDSYEDGFTYTNLSSAFEQYILEQDCESKRCGRLEEGDNNNNCSTSHKDCNVIRINGLYDTSQGPVVADVQGSQSICMGVISRNANSVRGNNHGSDASFSIGTYGVGSKIARMWLYDCVASGSGFDRVMGTGGALISDLNFVGDGRDSGIILSSDADNSPVFNNNITAWLDFSDDGFITMSGNKIVSVEDKSPMRIDARQNDSLLRLPAPTSKAGLYNGRKVVSPDDRIDGLSLDMVSELTIGDIYIVVSYKDGTAPLFESFETLLSGTQGSGKPRVMGSSGTANFHASSSDLAAGVSVNGAMVGAPVLPLPLSIVRATPTTPQTDLYTLFRHTANSARGWTGDIAEILVFNTANSEAQDALIQGYLSNKWGIS